MKLRLDNVYFFLQCFLSLGVVRSFVQMFLLLRVQGKESVCLSEVAHEPRLPEERPFLDSEGGVISCKG